MVDTAYTYEWFEVMANLTRLELKLKLIVQHILDKSRWNVKSGHDNINVTTHVC